MEKMGSRFMENRKPERRMSPIERLSMNYEAVLRLFPRVRRVRRNTVDVCIVGSCIARKIGRGNIRVCVREREKWQLIVGCKYRENTISDEWKKERE